MGPEKFLHRRRLETIKLSCIFLSVWSVTLSSSISAQNEEFISNPSGSDSLESFLETTRTLRAEFQQELWNSEGQLIERAAGMLWIKRPNQFLWNYQEPFEQLVVADGMNLWIYDVELGQVTVSPLDELISATPAMLLSGDQVVRDGFEVTENFTTNGINWVRLVPKLEGTDFNTVFIGFREGVLARLELLDGLDQVTEIQFEEVELNPMILDSTFNFIPPEGADVIGQPSELR